MQQRSQSVGLRPQGDAPQDLSRDVFLNDRFQTFDTHFSTIAASPLRDAQQNPAGAGVGLRVNLRLREARQLIAGTQAKFECVQAVAHVDVWLDGDGGI